MGKMAQRMETNMAGKSIFEPFFVVSSPFRAGGPKWICTRSTGLQRIRNSEFGRRKQNQAVLQGGSLHRGAGFKVKKAHFAA